MKLLRLVICFLLALSISAEARMLRGSAPALANNPATGGIASIQADMIPFVNIFKGASTANTASASFIYPNLLQAGTNLPIGNIPAGQKLAYNPYLPSNYTGQYVLSMPGASVSGTGLELNQNNFQLWGTVYSKSAGTTLSGCNNGNVPPCYWSQFLNVTGTNPQITFDLSAAISSVSNSVTTPGLIHVAWSSNNITSVSVVTITGVLGSDGNGCGANGQWSLVNRTTSGADLVGTSFPGGCTYTSGGQVFAYNTTQSKQLPLAFIGSTTTSSLTSLTICKLADYNIDATCNTDARHAWAGGFNDDFITKLATLRPSTIRFLDENHVFGQSGPTAPPNWNGWPTTSAAYYDGNNDWWDIPNWFGSNSGTNSYSIACSNGQACTYTLTAGAPKNGDFVQFFNVNANTSVNPTITITDASSVTSSAIPILGSFATQGFIVITGTPTNGDTISLTFTTTPVSAGTCLSGGTHTTSAFSVGPSTTLGNISDGLFAIVNADATLSAQNLALATRNPNGNSGQFQIGWANQACNLTVTANVTGSATETVSVGTLLANGLAANTLYSAVFNNKLKGFVLVGPTGGGAQSSWPWATQIALAQAVSAKSGYKIGCWLQIPIMWADDSFTSLANYAFSNQCPGGTYFEYSNEVWNPGFYPITVAYYLGTTVGLKGDNAGWYELRNRQLWGIASGVWGGITGNLHTTSNWQLGGGPTNQRTGTTLCGTSCGNQAYQNAVGVDYNSAPNRPIDYETHLGEAPYYSGAITDNYSSSGSYGSWSATISSVASNILTVGGTVTGTVNWNQGVASCDGTFITAGTSRDPTVSQLTGKVTTTLNGVVAANAKTWTLTSTAGLSAGMSVYDQTSGFANGTILSVNGGANQITIVASKTTYASSGSNDTIVFGGLAGTYQLNSTSCSIGTGTVTGGDVLGLQYAIDNYCTASGACSTGNAGLGSAQDSYNWFYQDSLNGLFNVNMSSSRTVQSNIAAAILLGASATTFGKTVADYEGGYQTQAPTQSQGASMSLPAFATASTVSNSGSGYTTGTQLITVSGGNCTTQPQFNVTVSGGVFTGTPALVTPGVCSGLPSNPASTTGGGGTGGTLNVTYVSLYGYSNAAGTDGYFNAALTAFKNSANFKALEILRHDTELAALPAGSAINWYLMSGKGRWGLFPGDLYSTPYQSFFSICTYNGNPC